MLITGKFIPRIVLLLNIFNLGHCLLSVTFFMLIKLNYTNIAIYILVLFTVWYKKVGVGKMAGGGGEEP